MPFEKIQTRDPRYDITEGLIILIADDERMLCDDIAFNIEELYPNLFSFYCETQSNEVASSCSALSPRVLILDKWFRDLQESYTAESGNMQKFAERFRRDYPQLSGTAIVIYSLFTQIADAAEYSDTEKVHGIWSFPKSLTNSRLARHIVDTVIPQWPRGGDFIIQ